VEKYLPKCLFVDAHHATLHKRFIYMRNVVSKTNILHIVFAVFYQNKYSYKIYNCYFATLKFSYLRTACMAF